MKDRTKLPKWAQHDIEVLERRLSEARDRIQELLDCPQSRVVLDAHGFHDEEVQYLPDETRIRFIPDGDHENSYRKFIDVYLDGEEVVIHGGHQLVSMPHVSNKMSVKLEEQ